MFGRFSTTIRADGALSRTDPQERREILAERVDLTVDVGRLIGGAGAAAERRRDGVDVVRAGENRNERCVGGHEWDFLLEDVCIRRIGPTAHRDSGPAG